MKIALAGNPNSGKTTLYNALTGSHEQVGNWAGVTVEKKVAPLRKDLSDGNITIVDLPGAYSMSPFTYEETITRDFVKNEKPDVIINIVDSSNLSRSLFFTTQLLELGIPVVVALNKMDLTKKKNIDINIEELSTSLKCSFVKTIASGNNKENGLQELVDKAISLNGTTQEVANADLIISTYGKDEVAQQDKARFTFVNNLLEKAEKRAISTNVETTQDKADKIIAHKWLGIPIFAAIMWLVFSISQSWIGPTLADLLVGLIEGFQGYVEGLLGENINPVLSSLLLDGIIGGVGAVVGFLPLIMVLFFLLALLEDCGYMARVAVVMDRFFTKVGLSGRSIIPMIIGTGCAIPGIMATRTIKNEREHNTTAMITPFIPCGAKVPVIALIADTFFHGAGWVSTTMYFLGILLIILSALIVQRITGSVGERSFFIIELPEYKFPSIKRAAISMLQRGKAFIVKAGTIILLCNAIVNILQTFNWSFQVVAEGAESTSILASIATPFAFLLIPLGFGVWQLAAAAITGFIAKENVVGTLAVVYGLTSFIDVEDFALTGDATAVAGAFGITSVAAFAYLAFNLYTPPCFAAIGALNSELSNKKWLWGALAHQFAIGYAVAFLIYQIGTLITTGTFGSGFIAGLIIVVAIICTYAYFINKGSKKALN